ncbi:orc1/cdc6 family replication initiation protein [Haladaptatus sp. DYF46]|uniref:Cdc6/Cdc18 family protein n=1 Tax=Haladaptatus sp. DYF46 TaxID=2886041 RepID=UPI001E60AE9D|nr:orc1/cdc6 family replication initiation protein [Haladaptatus sp. DYF46]
MGSHRFNRSTTPFRNREALLDDYTPDTFVGRDDELDEYHEALEPVIYGEQPNNIFLYGKTGVGKTAATKYLLRNLEEDANQFEDLELATAYINCDGFETSYRVGVALINALRDPADQISESGYSTSEIYAMLWDDLDADGGIVLLVLDEVDHINQGEDSILYQLSRARENENLREARVGVIGISNDLTFRDRLSPKVRSSLCERTISFPHYTATELLEVLEQRSEVAFKSNVLSNEVLPKCAALGAQSAGDARHALDLLLTAGDIARGNESETVQERHVDHALERVEKEEITEGISNLTEHEQHILYALATLDAEDGTPVRSREIYPRYRNMCSLSGRDAHTSRWLRDHLDELGMLGILSVTEKNEGLAGGKYREYDLQQELTLVVNALEDTLASIGVHESLRSYHEG